MKTIIARFTELKQNVDDPEIDAEGMDLNKVDTALKSVGVQLKDTTGSFRNLDDVFLELSSKWDTLTRNEQRYISTIAAGSRQQSRFIALMENYDRTLELVETAQNSVGRSDEQFAKYADTITYKVNQIKNSWEALRVSFLSSETYGKGLGFVNSFLNEIKDVDPKVLLVDVGIFAVLGKNIITGIVKALKDNVPELQTAFQDAFGSLTIDRRIQRQIDQLSEDFSSRFNINLNGRSVGELDTGAINTNLRDLADVNNQISRTEESAVRFNNAIAGAGSLMTSLTGRSQEQLVSMGNILRANQNLTREQQQQLLIDNQFVSNDEQIGDSDWAQLDIISRYTGELEGANNTLEQQRQKREQIMQFLKEQGFEEQYINSLNDVELRTVGQLVIQEQQRTLQKQEQLKKTKKIITSTLSSALSSGLISAFTVGLSTGDWGNALETGLWTALSAALPGLIQGAAGLVKTLLGAYLTPVIGVVIGAALIAGVVKLVDYFKSGQAAIDKAEKKVDQLQAKIDQQQQVLSEKKQDVDTYSEEKKSLEDLKKAYDDYTSKVIHTQEEQDEYQETLSKYAEDFPDLIKEQNDQYKLQNDLLKEQIELNEKRQAVAAKDYALEQFVLAGLERDKEKADYELEDTELNVDQKDEVAEAYNVAHSIGELKTGNTVFTIDSGSLEGQILDEDGILDYTVKTAEEISKIQDKEEREIYGAKGFIDKNEVFGEIQQLLAYDKEHPGVLKLNNENLNLMDLSEANDITDENLQDIIEILNGIYNTTTDNIGDQLKQSEDPKWIDAQESSKNSQESFEKSLENITYDAFKRSGVESNSLATYLAKNVTESNKSENVDMSDKDQEKEAQTKYEESYDEALKLSENESLQELATVLDEKLTDNLNFKEIDKVLDNQNNLLKKYSEEDQETQNLLADYLQTSVREKRIEWNKAKQNLLDIDPNIIDQSSREKGIFNADEVQNFTVEELNSISSIISTALGNIPEQKRQAYLESFKNLKESFKLSDKEFVQLIGGTDWADITTANYEEQLTRFQQNALNDTELSLEKSEELFDQAVKNFNDIGAIDITINPDGFEDYMEKVKSAYDEIGDETVYAISKLMDGAILDSDQLQSLQEWAEKNGEDWQDYYDQTTGTLKNVSSLNKAYNNAYEKQFKALSRTIEEIVNTVGGEEILKDYEKVINGEMEFATFQKQYSEEQIATVKQYFDIWKQGTTELKREQTELMLKQKEMDKEFLDDLQEVLDDAKEAEQELNDTIQEEHEKVQDALKDIDDQVAENAENVQEALEEIDEAIEDVEEKTKELNEALYGTDSYLSKRDSFQNYTDRLEQLEKTSEKLKDALDNPQPGDDISQLVKNYGEAIHQEMVYQEALNRRKEDQKNEILGYLQSFGSEYFTVVDGLLQANYAAIDNAQMNDQLKDQIYEYLDQYNEVQNEIIEGEEKYSDLLQEMKDRRKTALDNLVELQKNTAEVLKSSYEQEIEDVQNKYDAIKEADDEYLSALEEAINKQRQLREQESQWNDLATKEKKLSLMQRDTSGTQQQQVVQLEQEIQDDRQNLLDNTVDNILDTLRETYEEQQKEREEELAYQQQMVEDMNFMKQALEVLQSMTSSQDYVNWLIENNPDYQDMTEFEQIQYVEDHENDFAAYQTYQDLDNANFEDYLQFATEEVDEAMRTTNDNMNEYLQTSHQNVLDTVQEEQETAQQALADAQASLDEAYANYDNTIIEGEQKLQELQQAYDEAVAEEIKNVNEARDAYKDAMDEVNKKGFDSIAEMQTYVDAALAGYSDAVGETGQSLINAKTNALKALAEYTNTLSNLDQQIANRADDAGNPEKSTYATQEAWQAWVDAKNARDDFINNTVNFDSRVVWNGEGFDLAPFYNQYATGGLVDYTGPAWVDGTPSRPEAFLSSEDTARIGAAAELLSNIPALNSSSIDNSYSSNIGDTTIEVHINVENVSSEVDIDEAVQRVEDDIVKMSNSIGNSIYLSK